MTTMAHHPVTTATFVLLFWIVAAVLVTAGHLELDARSRTWSAAVSVAAVVAVSYGYTRLCARCSGIDHALAVGVAWLVLTIVAEATISTRVGHGWYALIGAPDRPLLRNLFLFVWVFAPALFARREAAE